MDDVRTDEMLMLSYRDGDAAAFEVLYARHRGRLFRYFLRHCKDRARADELFQETWIAVIKASFAYEVSAKFSTWLFRIAHHRLIDAFRAQARVSRVEVEWSDEDLDAPDAPAPAAEEPARRLERRELAERIVAAVEALPGAQRDAFLMAAEGGLTVEEIGNATGVGYETAKSRLRYAYGRLRKTLEAWR